MSRLLSSIILSASILLANPAQCGDVEQGGIAPEFNLSDQNGKNHTLENYRDQWLALYFYPKDDTPGCTTEACEFRDDIFKFRRMGCAVLGVSLDSADSHKAFAEKHGLPFPLLADTDGTTAEAYGVKAERFGVSRAKRETFLIDPEGNIARHYTNVDPASHSQQILTDLEELAEN